MAFYESLAPFYDEIFPVNVTACDFLLSFFEKADLVLDVGAGTGNMAIALAKKGLRVIAAEPDVTMADYIRQKAVEENVTIPVHIKAMQGMDQITEKVNGIYCIGNTLPHVSNAEELKVFINKCHELLSEGDRFILQLVNYEKVLSAVEDFSFPVIQKEGLLFTREYRQEGDKIIFTTNLNVKGDSFSNSIPLFPITSRKLIPILQETGFEVEHIYGNFARQDYSANSPALIVVAKK